MKVAHNPRYRVGSVTGVRIDQATTSAGGGKKPMPVIWYVHDCAFGFRIVADAGFKEPEARRIAAELNACEQAWLENVA